MWLRKWLLFKSGFLNLSHKKKTPDVTILKVFFFSLYLSKHLKIAEGVEQFYTLYS